MSNIIDHIGVNVRDYARSKAFYSAALAPLGLKLVMEFGPGGGFGRDKEPAFWISQGKSDFQTEEQIRVITPVHLCFGASSRAEVDAFYHAALEAGGKDNGPPGLRPQYHPNYYGAFVLDLDGHNIEAVFHGPA